MAMEIQDQKIYRVFADGCFDLTHWGHLRVFKQAKEKRNRRTYVLIGIHSDVDIAAVKAPPLISETDRYFCARACRWVDEVVEAAPYAICLDTLAQYNVDFVVHGTDITRDANGNDCYANVKALGKYENIDRTDGISTSEVINRMLAIAIPSFTYNRRELSLHQLPSFVDLTLNLPDDPTARLPNYQSDTIVYIDGSFDLLHVGTLKALRAAKQLGTYLIVGVHLDAIVHRAHGKGFPITSMYERVFSVLACRWVDACIPAAPWTLDMEYVNQFGIQKIAVGNKDNYSDQYSPYKAVQHLVYPVHSGSDVTTRSLCHLVGDHQERFIARNIKKGEITTSEIPTNVINTEDSVQNNIKENF